MKTIKKYTLHVALTLLVAACTYDFPVVPEPTPGSADFSKMVSIGNSLTAGFMNNALYTNGQNASFVKIMAEQMTAVGGGDFNQADIDSQNGCANPGGGCTQGRLYLKYSNFPASTAAGPVNSTGSVGNLMTALTPAQRTALNNYGVPGATILSATNAGLSANPHYARIASNPGTSTLIGDAAAALAAGGTFFTFWLGNNDVLGYATGGASVPAALTSVPNFEAAYDAAINAVLAANTNAKGVVANIPDVTSIPFFRTVPYNPIELSSEGQATALNDGYATYNGGLDAAFAAQLITAAERDQRKIVFRYKTIAEGQPGYATAPIFKNSLVIEDETLTDLSALGMPNYRQTTSADLIVLPAASIIPGGGGTSSPLQDQWVLIPAEITEIQNRIAAFNAKIASVVSANSSRLVLVNANAILAQLATTGASINGSALTASISPPFGAFSLDGVHPNARGHAYIANKFIEAINAKFGSSIPLCNPNDYPGNELPVP